LLKTKSCFYCAVGLFTEIYLDHFPVFFRREFVGEHVVHLNLSGGNQLQRHGKRVLFDVPDVFMAIAVTTLL